MFTHSKQWITVGIVAVLFLGIVTACSSNSNQPSGSPIPSNNNTNNESPQPSSDAKIVFWHYLNDRHALLQEMAENFQAETGIEVDVQLFGGDGFAQKIVAAAQTRSLPDLVTFSGGAGDLGKLINNGNILELGMPLGEWFDKFPETIVKTYSYEEGNVYNVTDSGIYALPMDTNNMQFIYNTELFAQAGITSAPATWDQMLDAVDRLNDAGITPFATGIGSWVIGALAGPYEIAYLGEEKLVNVKQGVEPFVDSGYLNVLKKFEELYEHNAYAQGIATMDLPYAEQLFVNGEVAMIFDGSWAIGVFNEMNPGFTQYDAFLPPQPADAPYDVKITGGIGVPLVVSKETLYPEETLAFVKYLTEKEQQQKYAQTSFNLPANLEASASEDGMTSALRNFSQGMAHVYESTGVYPNPNVNTVMEKGVQLIAIGELTAEEVLQQIDEELRKALNE